MGKIKSKGKHTVFHDDGSISDVYPSISGDVHTSFNSKGSTSHTYKNIFDDGYTTYHDGGGKSRTYKNAFDDGYTTYHSNGEVTRTYKSLTNDNYRSTTYKNGDFVDGFAALGAFAILFITVICAVLFLKSSIILPLVILIGSIVFGNYLGTHIDVSLAFYLIQPFAFFGTFRIMLLLNDLSSKGDFILHIFGWLGGIVLDTVVMFYILPHLDGKLPTVFLGVMYLEGILCAIMIKWLEGDRTELYIFYYILLLLNFIAAVIRLLRFRKNHRTS